MKLADLTPEERLALGGLVRLIIRADGSFSKEEEERIDRIGEEIGTPAAFWKAISDSAQAFRADEEIRDAALAVDRAGARELILDVIAGVAAADTMSPSEMSMIEALRESWSRAGSVA